MKTTLYIFLIILLFTVYSCNKKDNYSPPNAQLTGAILYQGDSIYLEYNRVPYQLYQYGFGKVGPIDGAFTQSGTFNSLLFNGDYRFIVPNGQGPFLWPQTSTGSPDTINITMNGSQNLNIEVMPYYMIRDAQISGNAGNVSASFKAEKVITDANARDIESVTLFINRTQFVSGTDNVARVDLAGADITDPNNISLSVAVPSLSQSYVYARVGLKVAGLEDLIFSPLFQITYQ